MTSPPGQPQTPELDEQDKQLLAEIETKRTPKASAQPASAGIMTTEDLGVSYGDFLAVSHVNLGFVKHEITALIGPSGCGKSTVLRCLNRMNDLIPGAKVHGSIKYHGQDIYEDSVDVIRVRRHVGMVFQKPNPFPKSIYDNIAYGPRVTGMKTSDMDEIVEALCSARRCGTRSRTSSSRTRPVCPAVSSSGCALRGPLRPVPK